MVSRYICRVPCPKCDAPASFNTEIGVCEVCGYKSLFLVGKRQNKSIWGNIWFDIYKRKYNKKKNTIDPNSGGDEML